MRIAITTLCLFGLLVVPARSNDLWERLFTSDEVNSAPARDSQIQTFPLRVRPMTGSTGSSAQQALVRELVQSRRIRLVDDESARAEVGGKSVGGRVTGWLRLPGVEEELERTYAAPGLDENLKAFADDIVYALTGVPGLATSRIAFVSDRTGSRQIYTCNSEGGEILQITRDPFGAVSPSLSPDASLLAYTSYQNGFPEVIVVDLGGGFERSITDTPGSCFGASFSPNGRHLALIMSFLGNPELFITDLNSNTAACASETVGVPSSPSWHPDGRRIAYSIDDGKGPRLYLADMGSAKQSAGLDRIQTGYSFTTDPEWSPNGRQIAFTARRRGSWLVGIKNHPGGKVSIVRKGAQHPSWSPDGRYLVYAEKGSLIRHDMVTGNRRTLVEDFGSVTEPRWMH